MITFIFNAIHYLKIFQIYLGRRMHYLFLLSLFIGLIESVGILLLIPVFQGFDNKDIGQGGDEISIYIYEVLLKLGLSDSTVTVLSIIALVFIIKGLLLFMTLSYDAYLRSQLIKELRRDLYKLYNNMEYEHFTTKDTGYFINIINGQIKSTLVSFDSLITFVTQFIYALVYVSIAFAIAWNFGLMVLFIGFFLFFFFKFINRYVVKLSRNVAAEEGNLTKLLIQALHAFKYLIATDQNNRFIYKINKSIKHLANYQMRSGLAYAFTSSVREPITVTSMIAIMIIQLTINEQPLAPILVSMLLYYRGLNSILGIQSSWQRTLESIGSMEMVHQEFESQKKHQVRGGKSTMQKFKKHIRLENVFFRYRSNVNNIINNVNVKIIANTSVAFIGHSGSGKSTLIDLITLIIKPSSGMVLLDGINSNDIDLSSWRSQIGFVSQETIIFDDSIANNICLSDDRVKYSMTDIVAAAKKAHLNEFIESLPNGYETMVGDRGMLLSGGQKQRLFIARELYRNPKILILDEATSALDSESESKIQNSIDELKGKVTVIIIAHRLSTIKNVDYVYVLNDGEIVESGSYSNLRDNSLSNLNKLIKLQRS
jgi:ABC-type multidrug transport system fused ATPase/permease subunit